MRSGFGQRLVELPAKRLRALAAAAGSPQLLKQQRQLERKKMRGVLLVATVVAGIGGMSAQAQAVCNVRGEFCGYPAWAANAFTAPRDRVPDSWLENPPGRIILGYRAERPHRVHRAKKHRYR